ncbi:MAG TPA: histidine kinase N-terminal 7TM domain-containing protein [Anaerolineae bacterium]|nr:histidine kinase N-terminal 7TM domain-containing protein [Anaerolineae bacterium]
MGDLSRWITGGLILTNQVLAATIVLTSFSLLIYLLTHNIRSAVARAFCALLLFMLIVYVGDVALVEVKSQNAAVQWLRFQWIGIALVPAAYLDFSDALFRTTGARHRTTRAAIWASYLVSLVVLGLVYGTELVVTDGIYSPAGSHLAAGPLFWVFAAYFGIAVVWGAVNVRRARRRCLTSASRRRMTYLGLAFAAPALGAFPYLMLTGVAAIQPANGFRLLVLAGNIAVLLMLLLMAYSVAYFGALTPDRVVRHDLIHYMLRGPLVGAVLIFIMLAVPKVEQILGLPRDTVLIFAVVGFVVFLQLAINLAKPFIDRAIYRQDREEITWIQTLDRRLLTSADLDAFLENTLAALCDLLQVRTGFVAIQAGEQHRLERYVGDEAAVREFVAGHDLSALIASGPLDELQPFAAANGFWLAPLTGQKSESVLGVLGLEARSGAAELTAEEHGPVLALIDRAQEALEDRYLQESVFDTLKRILPEIELLHRWQDAAQFSGSPPVQALQDSPIYAPEFQQWVRDALGHYWGGPKLSESPLLGLRLVRDLMREQQVGPAHAVRAVLTAAIERLRPAGEQKMTASEWLLYNIIDMKFIRGLRVQDIARRMAMSESDLYRKQRVAIAEVAKALLALERDRSGLSTQGEESSARQRTA